MANASTLARVSAVIANDRRSAAIRQSRCEGVARGNLKSSLALLGTRLRRLTPRKDTLFKASASLKFNGNQV